MTHRGEKIKGGGDQKRLKVIHTKATHSYTPLYLSFPLLRTKEDDQNLTEADSMSNDDVGKDDGHRAIDIFFSLSFLCPCFLLDKYCVSTVCNTQNHFFYLDRLYSQTSL